MAKVGTAVLEIKPVLNTEALDAVVAEIEARVSSAMSGETSGDADWSTLDLHRLASSICGQTNWYFDTMSRTNDNATEDYLAQLGRRVLAEVAAWRAKR